MSSIITCESTDYALLSQVCQLCVSSIITCESTDYALLGQVCQLCVSSIITCESTDYALLSQVCHMAVWLFAAVREVKLSCGYSSAYRSLLVTAVVLHNIRPTYVTRGQLGCGPPHPAQKVLILAQKWLSGIVSTVNN